MGFNGVKYPVYVPFLMRYYICSLFMIMLKSVSVLVKEWEKMAQLIVMSHFGSISWEKLSHERSVAQNKYFFLLCTADTCEHGSGSLYRCISQTDPPLLWSWQT